MTSNHPEKLDPALIRPGRVNLKLYLGYIELPEARDMVEHYFGGFQGKRLSNAQYDELTRVWGMISEQMQLTPAPVRSQSATDLVRIPRALMLIRFPYVGGF